MDLKVTYVHHSSFLIETKDNYFLFDYFKGDIELKKDKKAYIFSTHSHPDHYSDKIYSLSDNATYILSDDIKSDERYKPVYVSPYNSYDIDGFKLHTFGSTDLGISLILSIGGKNIFFSGDLNDWYWEMEDDEKQRLFMHEAFNKELDLIKKYEIDVCFFPVDGRQEGQWDLGGRQVLEKLEPKNFFPMHFWNKYEITNDFKEKYEDKYKNTDFFVIKSKNESFDIII